MHRGGQGTSTSFPPGCWPISSSAAARASASGNERATGTTSSPAPARSHQLGPHGRAELAAGGPRTGDGQEALVPRPIRGRDRDDATAVGHQGQRHRDRLLGAHAVERRGDALRRGGAHALRESVPVGDRLAAEAAYDVVVRRAGRADHPCADPRGLLEHADADGTGRTVHQDRVAAGDADHVQHLGGGRAGEQQVGGLAEGQRRRLGEDVLRRHGHLRRPAAADAEGEDLVTHRHRTRADLGPRSDRGDDPGDLVADRPREVAGAGRHVLGVRGVHPGGADGDRDLSRLWGGDVVLLEHEDVEAARTGRDPPMCHRPNLAGTP